MLANILGVRIKGFHIGEHLSERFIYCYKKLVIPNYIINFKKLTI